MLFLQKYKAATFDSPPGLAQVGVGVSVSDVVTVRVGVKVLVGVSVGVVVGVGVGVWLEQNPVSVVAVKQLKQVS
jgi:hypothetical protein